MKAYDAQLFLKPDWAKRTSYVIAPTGEILYLVQLAQPRQARCQHDGSREEVGGRAQGEERLVADGLLVRGAFSRRN